ncbi:GPP34 family phosphoprotein [Flammeovirgaceae bacterium SG7u.111]|nr:GPP34 family phosphoprotein [Flammeovirgaceae bacterium SG7u.132]WPO35569.1 GPP34 family phosphoprotein [Flammeovirgaceae bacterium SG7u.111]
MKLKLPEELMLLALNDHTGNITPAAAMYINFSMSCAILLELAIAERIQLKNNVLELFDEGKKVRDPLILEGLEAIEKSGKKYTIDHWTQELVFYIEDFQKKLLDSLIDKGILIKDKKKIIGIFSKSKYILQAPEVKQQITKRLHELVLNSPKPSARTIMLISLVGACNLTGEVFKDAKKQKIAREKIEDISMNMIAGIEINRLIHDIQEAVGRAVNTAVPILPN